MYVQCSHIMITQIIKIGNSRGIRIPKSLIKAAELGETIDLTLENNKIVISKPLVTVNEEALLSEVALREWLMPEEDAAWKHLQ